MPDLDYTITVSMPYRVCFTHDVFSPSNSILADLMPNKATAQVLVMLEADLPATQPMLEENIIMYGRHHGLAIQVMFFDGGEKAKDEFDPLGERLACIVGVGIDRHSYVVAVGGGAHLDVIGFAAATAHRGVRLIRVPTTTLSQADSGVGVKCGINYCGQKNYLGSFVVPWATIVDFNFLHSQPSALKRAGLAEVLKVALVADGKLFDWIEQHAEALADGEPATLEYAVEQSACLHAHHIAKGGDPFELGTSRPLDFGHWSAHYLESMSSYLVSHAEAVSVGMALDIAYSVRIGWLDAVVAQRIYAVMRRLQLPICHLIMDVREGTDYAVLGGLDAFREHLGGELTILLLEDVGKGRDATDVDRELMSACIADMIENSPLGGV